MIKNIVITVTIVFVVFLGFLNGEYWKFKTSLILELRMHRQLGWAHIQLIEKHIESCDFKGADVYLGLVEMDLKFYAMAIKDIKRVPFFDGKEYESELLKEIYKMKFRVESAKAARDLCENNK